MNLVPLRKSYRHRNRPARNWLQPIPIPTPTNAVRSFVRAAIASGLNALNKSQLPSEHAARTWPDDHAVPILARAVSDLQTLANAGAQVLT